MSFETFNGFIKSMFDGAAEARKENYYQRKFREMEKTNLLFDIDELDDMTDHAGDYATAYDDCNTILDHIYRFDATRVKGYQKIEKKIINKMWED